MTPNPELGNADLVYEVRALATGAAVLVVGAHPDDEETGLLAYLSRRLSARVVYWSATRGEGGQNRAGPERGAAFGIVRTWESLSAREVDGAEVLYGPFYDFGYVKTAEAALARWGAEDVVAEIVRAIRMVQPQVVIARWSGGPSDGHGHHRAVGVATVSAFDASRDPSYLAGPGTEPPPWRPSKLYCSLAGDWQPGEAWVSGAQMPEYERQGCVRINTGFFDPVAGCSYEELAAKSRNRHRSQGLSFLPEAGDYFYYLRRLRGPGAVPDQADQLFDGVDASLAGQVAAAGGPPGVEPLLERAAQCAAAAVEAFRPDRPRECGELALEFVDLLRQARQIVVNDANALARDAASVRRLLDRKVADGERVAARCLGLRGECLVERARLIPGTTFRVVARLWDGEAVDPTPPTLELPEGWQAQPVPPSDSDPPRAIFDVTVPDPAPLTCPYWLRRPATPYRYLWPAGVPCGQAFDGPLVGARWSVAHGAHRLSVGAVAVERSPCSGGYRELPLEVVPPVALNPQHRLEILPAAHAAKYELQVGLEGLVTDAALVARLALPVPRGWGVHPRAVAVPIRSAGRQRAAFEIAVPSLEGDSVHRLAYDLAVGDRHSSVVLNAVRLASPGTPGPVDESNCAAEALLVEAAAVEVHLVAAEFFKTLRYGYIPGAEESVVVSLAHFGLDMTVLAVDRLGEADLHRYDAIVVGPNAYVVHAGVRANAARLLEYVEQGGTLVVQYQSYPYEAEGLAPYPFRFYQPHGRVTYPDAPVMMLDPDDTVLRSPNKIDPGDFEGWVHDRGLYFFGEWDARYRPLLASHDPGEDPLSGGLLVAAYGQGSYVYTGYSFFRQIPAGVPGAIRLFANLIGLAETKILERRERLRGVELFSSLAETEAYDVARAMSERSWPEGAELCGEGDRDSDLFLPLQGEIDVVRDEAGQRRLLYRARPGEAVGELALLADIPRSATLVARTPVTALVLRGTDFSHLMASHPELAPGFLKLLARKLAGQAPGG
ncbi:MAG: cyclic nucleotide-binding domain-containing protein [Acidimicrobiales bacterium]